MCGRFTLRVSADDVAATFGVSSRFENVARFNIAPSQRVLAIRLNADHQREPAFLQWGLIPSWADDKKIGYATINARAETVATKPAFRKAFRRGRCLIVADGFYEWKTDGKAKRPYFIRMKNDSLFAFAGLHERWERDGEVIDSCAIITTTPNELMADIHDRMPVILSPHDCGHWLDPEFNGPEQLQLLLSPYPAFQMTAYPVSTLVNSPRNDSAACVVEV